MIATLFQFFLFLQFNPSDVWDRNPVALSDTLYYQNPVFEPVLADPTVIYDGEFFYAYGTEDTGGKKEAII
ncbi:hypothetical protein V8V91_15290 [Algoriphagus halophilus]|uniref:hypothetical protein n=1 Tax=Algoriphagus halophilus TaxID=226505 RepID=UPI00358F81F7